LAEGKRVFISLGDRRRISSATSVAADFSPGAQVEGENLGAKESGEKNAGNFLVVQEVFERAIVNGVGNVGSGIGSDEWEGLLRGRRVEDGGGGLAYPEDAR
jgi:hypothetical protein